MIEFDEALLVNFISMFRVRLPMASRSPPNRLATQPVVPGMISLRSAVITVHENVPENPCLHRNMRPQKFLYKSTILPRLFSCKSLKKSAINGINSLLDEQNSMKGAIFGVIHCRLSVVEGDYRF